MRVVHDRKVRKLKRMDERGAEAHKIDAIRREIKDLSTKIRMAIQVVDKISVMISKIRDEELWPLTNELIQGYVYCASVSINPFMLCDHVNLVLAVLASLVRS